jgi:hypothetical protein
VKNLVTARADQLLLGQVARRVLTHEDDARGGGMRKKGMESVVDGVLVRVKKVDEGLLRPGQVVDISGVPWTVESVRESGARVRRASGVMMIISSRSIVPRLTPEDVEKMMQAADRKKAVENDLNCKCGHEYSRHNAGGTCLELVEGETSGYCPCESFEHSARRLRKWTPTEEDVARVFALRAEGKTYQAIETEMGWPAERGMRPWRVVKGKLTAKLKE